MYVCTTCTTYIHTTYVHMCCIMYVVYLEQYVELLYRVDQFSNLEGIAGRILGYCEHGPTFFVREILDGIAAHPGGDYIH